MSAARRAASCAGLWRRAESRIADHSAWRPRHAVPRHLVSQGPVRPGRQEGDPHLRPAVARQGLSNTSSRRCRDRRRRIPTRSSSSSARPIPAVKRQEGEAYRDLAAAARAAELGVDDHVVFYDQFIDTKTLTEFLSTADVCVTPYLNREQIVSGVLSYALGAGKAIVSTPYRYAEEMLADGRGRLVPFRDGEAIAREIIDLLSNDVERQAMRKRAYTFARDMVWSEVGAQYLAALPRGPPRARRPAALVSRRETLQIDATFELPAPKSRSPARPHRRHRHSPARPLRRSRPQSRLLHRRQCPRPDRRACSASTSCRDARFAHPARLSLSRLPAARVQSEKPAASATS